MLNVRGTHRCILDGIDIVHSQARNTQKFLLPFSLKKTWKRGEGRSHLWGRRARVLHHARIKRFDGFNASETPARKLRIGNVSVA
jgi:hypothetical protein